jgi:hypothetical protein
VYLQFNNISTGGVVVPALASYHCDPCSIPGLPCFSGFSGFTPPQKSTLLNSKSIMDEGSSFFSYQLLRATLLKQRLLLFIYLFIYLSVVCLLLLNSIYKRPVMTFKKWESKLKEKLDAWYKIAEKECLYAVFINHVIIF